MSLKMMLASMQQNRELLALKMRQVDAFVAKPAPVVAESADMLECVLQAGMGEALQLLQQVSHSGEVVLEGEYSVTASALEHQWVVESEQKMS